MDDPISDIEEWLRQSLTIFQDNNATSLLYEKNTITAITRIGDIHDPGQGTDLGELKLRIFSHETLWKENTK